MSDTDLGFIRALSVHGLQLALDMPKADFQEKVRVAILTSRLAGKDFEVGPDGAMETFREAYERRFERSLDLRRTLRDAYGRVIIQPLAPRSNDVHEDADEDEDEDEC